MSKLVDNLRKLLGDDIDDDLDAELKKFGRVIHNNGGSGGGSSDPEEFSQTDGGIELFSEVATDDFQVDKETGWFWAPAIRSGQWAVRPGPGGKKQRKPLKVIAGKSKDQRKEIGLQDLLDAFKDNAVEHVTVPTSHNYNILENTGLIRDMKIVDGVHKDKPCKVLMTAYDFTEPEVKGKVERGTIPNRSCGILYDYTNTETGKTYPAVIEHIALTAKPWITGLKAFGKRLKDKLSDDVVFEGMVLSDEDEMELSEELEEFAEVEVAWNQSESYSFRRDSIQRQLDQMRSECGPDMKPPYYYVDDVTDGKALITEGYGRSSRKWVAGFTIDDDDVTLSPVIEWKRVREQLVTDTDAEDEKPAVASPKDEKTDASYQAGDAVEPAPETARDRLAVAQAERTRGDHGLSELRRRQAEILSDSNASAEDASTLVRAFRLINVSPAPGLLKKAGQLPLSQDPTHPKGGEQMDPEKEKEGGKPPEDARVAELQAKLDQAEADRARLAQSVERLTGTVTGTQTKDYITSLSESGFKQHPGVLREVERALLADDGGPAVVVNLSDEDGGEDETELSVSDVVKRIFGAFEKDDDGRVKLSTQAAETETSTKKDGESKDGGKPAKEETEAELSAKEKVDSLFEDDPDMAAELERMGIRRGDSTNGKQPAGVAASGDGGPEFAEAGDEGGDE